MSFISNIKDNIGSIKRIVYSTLIFLSYFMICDILLFFCCHIDVNNVNFLHIILMNLSFAMLFAFLYYFCSFNYRKCLIFFLLVIIDIIYITEILIYSTFSNFFSFKDIFRNVKNVFGNFGGEVVFIIFNHLVVILLFVVINILLYITIKKILDRCFFDNKYNIYLIMMAIIVFIFSLFLIGKAPLNFNMFLSKYGLKSSMFCHPLANDNQYDIKIEEEIMPIEEESIVEVEDDTNEYSLHRWNINFDTNINENIDMNYILMNSYVQSILPTSENKYTGLFKGKNLILICAEAFSKYVIDKDLTPTLYRLYNNGFKFTDFYQPCWYGSTSGGEYSFLTGLVPTDTTCSTLKAHGHNMGLTMPNMLKKDGYSTAAFHNGSHKFYDRDVSHDETLGFDYFMATGNGLEELAGEFCGDGKMFEKTLQLYKDKAPFCVYYMTLTGHAFYNDNKSYKVKKYLKRVKDRYGDKYSDQINNYFCAQLYLEDGLKLLIENLEKENLLDDTVICVVPDHYPYGLTNNTMGNPFTDGVNYIEELYNIKDYNDFERDNNAWLLWCSTLEKEDKKYVKTISHPTFSLDVLPTLLNLFGLDYDSRLLVGNDVFSEYEHIVFDFDENFVADDMVCFNEKKEYISKTGKPIDEEKRKAIRTKVHNKILFSKFVLDNDYYDYIYKHKK